MKVLVLGSEGQIGQYVQPRPGYEIIRSDIALGPLHDLRRPGTYVETLIKDADFVLFLAFDVGGSRYLARKQYSYSYLDDNIRILRNTFELLELTGKPFIYVSSQMSNMLDSSYGMLKRIGEFYAEALLGITVRLWNVYGKERDPAKFHVITDFINMARDGEIKMRTDGYEQRQFLWGEDCADALFVLIENYRSLTWKRYDVTSFEWISILDIARKVAALTPGNVIVRPGTERDLTQLVKNEPGGQILSLWKPKTSISDGIRMLMS